MLVDKDGVLVSEFQLTENALAQPEAFVAALNIDRVRRRGRALMGSYPPGCLVSSHNGIIPDGAYAIRPSRALGYTS